MIFFLFTLVLGSPKCAILVDAGSSGSRFWIYSWTDGSDTWDTSIPSDLMSANPYKAEPGIIDYFTNTEAMKNKFQEGIDEVLAYIDSKEDLCQDTADIPMWLMSTAGLRTETNEEVNNILDEIGKWMAANVPFDWMFARLLSGEEEAIYAWVATNHVLGRFEGDVTVGILEMGGQSMQIAFQPADGIIMDNSYDIELLGKTYRVYANSWNGFGMNAIRESLHNIVTTAEQQFFGWNHTNHNATNFPHPCLPAGWSNEISSAFDWPFEGGYSSNGCSFLMDYFYNNYAMLDLCAYSACSITGQYVSDMKNVDFYAKSTFQRVIQTLNNLDDTLGTSPSYDRLSEAIEEYCALNITQLSLQVEGYYQKYDSIGCLQSNIIISLLEKLPNLGMQATVTYDTAKDANGVEGSWLLGALIDRMHEITKSDEKHEGDDENRLPYLIVVATFAMLFFIVAMASCYLLHQAKRKSKNNEVELQGTRQNLEAVNLTASEVI